MLKEKLHKLLLLVGQQLPYAPSNLRAAGMEINVRLLAVPGPSFGTIENGHPAEDTVLCPVSHHICDAVGVLFMCCEVAVGEECWPGLNAHEKVMRLILPFGHSIDVEALGRGWIMQVELQLVKMDGYLVQGYRRELYKSQLEDVTCRFCSLECVE